MPRIPDGTPGRVAPAFVLTLAFVLACNPARAQGEALELVRGTLKQFAGTTPVTATLERAVTSDRKGRPLEAGRIELEVAAGRRGTTLQYPAALLAALQAERGDPDPEKPKPYRRTLDAFDAADVADLLNAAPQLLSDLEGATLRSDTATEHDGRPARRLELELVLRVSKADQKWLKSGSRIMQLWVTPEGLPLAEQVDAAYSVGLLFFTFDATETRTQSFARAGDRLVALRRTNRFDGEGLGEAQHFVADNTLRLLHGS